MNIAHISIRRAAWLMPVVILMSSASTAHAHILGGESGGFAAGFEHPWSGWDHIVAMLAVGMWGAQLGKPAIWALPVTFPIIMSLGGFMGLMGVPLPGVEIGIAASAIVLGAMVCFAARPPLYVAMVLVGIFGLFHGYAHGAEAPGGNLLLFSLGFVVATGTLHLIGIGIGEIHRVRWGQPVLRTCGAVVALAGLYFLWAALGPAEEETPEPAQHAVSSSHAGSIQA